MQAEDLKLILASTSPRRRELLGRFGLPFEVLGVEVEEVPRCGEAAEDYVRRVASDKSARGQSMAPSDAAVLAADTEVVLDGQIFGKPQGAEHAREMLGRLSGRTHEVLSAVSLRRGDCHWQALSVSRVRFRDLGLEEIDAYWASGEPADKAGAYAIQGRGELFVAELQGSFSGVMGLPLLETARLLRHLGLGTARLLAGAAP
ncbi:MULTISPECIES: Maf family protein [Methylococcus]|jgi:septum formation protein|uniref:dTTP/UTP pyrophosphatase n=2 Tax=Methylococcus capsulatus TaxID=414 RepID=NTPPA_METCA|nr:nucleoside triphosphate pyrophosphatase [Methylococcus capsulatus]Q60BT7.1 RecName: Full=dTTP/UTP pyrophosphatase; Short=dTTPase/UTPase; AltName: Full=Nucleoside triphosphate pyrophosphatase; AltName: Full=Nucleotide pyrophosphatase; Short=Nucleotide PPase [Methylococcus capsulatus str. Bath]AAU90502.1 maf protein [Methylococcus capsulatus str. Bath]QXP89831.1 Maf family nucleotide pyrophosphatase [Methylococcus capsulatus]QXP94177.1 Maf family nucleotide pyrophosphatase [Methylococcus capsu